MKIQYFAFFYVIFAFTQSWRGCEAFLKLKDFPNKIAGKCYGFKDDKELPNGQLLPIPNSIEAFITLVEKIERSSQMSRKPDEILRTLLANFRYDDLKYDKPTNSFSTRGDRHVTIAYEMLLKLFNDPVPAFTLDEIVTQDEQCAMYYMISHTVNDSLRVDEEILKLDNQQIVSKYPREQGVVSVLAKSKHAFALGKVLLGLLAGLTGNTQINANSILGKLKPGESRTELESVEIDILYAATFGDIVSVGKYEMPSPDSRPFFQPNGEWFEPVCPLYYVLENNDYRKSHSTRSLVRGAVDGYALGYRIKELVQSNSNLRLSQVLRSYYSGLGFREHDYLTWCSRRNSWSDARNKDLTKKAVAYDMLHTVLSDGTMPQDTIQRYIESIMNAIDRDQDSLFDAVMEDSVCQTASTASRDMPEPQTDIIAIMDFKAQEQQVEAQSSIIGNVTTGFQMRYDGSSVSVYTNLKPVGTGMDALVNESHLSGCGGCAVRYLKPLSMSPENELKVMTDLNKTLCDMQSRREDENGIPGTIVLYFNYQRPQVDENLRRIIREIKRNHLSTKIFAFGTQKDVLSIFVRNDDTDIFVETNTETVVNKLKNYVLKMPAEFQFHNCHLNRPADEENAKYEGFVTPNHIQYWAMNPKFFLKSFDITMFFKAVTGQIRVCFSRDYSAIFENRGNAKCYDVSPKGEPAKFYESNPCHRYSVTSCRPFYFSIQGSKVPDEACTDLDKKKCASPDQIKFEFSHKGISCSGAAFLSCAISTVFFMIAASLSRIFVH